MKYINNIGYLQENTYYRLGSSNRQAVNDFDSVLEAETIIYATPETRETNTGSGNLVTSKETVTGPAEWDSIFNRAAAEYNVDVNLLKAVAKTESNFNTNATSSAGAMGVMQLMPATAQYLGVTDAYDPEQNIMGGARYISRMLQKYDGDVALALAAYNAGPGNVDRYGGIPPFEETQNYVQKIMSYLENGAITYPVNNVAGSNTSGNIAHNSLEGDVTYITATGDSTIPTSQPDVATIYAVAASDITSPAKLNL